MYETGGMFEFIGIGFIERKSKLWQVFFLYVRRLKSELVANIGLAVRGVASGWIGERGGVSIGQAEKNRAGEGVGELREQRGWRAAISEALACAACSQATGVR